MTINPQTAGLILLDFQGGVLARALAPYDAATVVAAAARLGRAFESGGGLIVKVRVEFAADFADAPKGLVDEPFQRPPGGFPASFSELAAPIAALKGPVVIKRNVGAFHGTELDTLLRRRGVETIVLGGVATNFAVEMTAREGFQLNYHVVVAEDASTSFSEAMHRFPIEHVLPRVARVRNVDKVIKMLKAD